MRKLILPFLFLFLAAGVSAQDRFYVDADFRTRGMYTHGYTRPLNFEEPGSFFIGQRGRVGLGYQHRNIGLYIQTEGTFAWGQREKLGTPVHFNLSQVWFYADFGKGFGVKLGRRPMYWEDGRYLSTSGWAEAFGTHDALDFYYKSEDGRTQAQIVGSYASSGLDQYTLRPYSSTDYYRWWAACYASHRFIDDVRWSVIFSNHWNQALLPAVDSCGPAGGIDSSRLVPVYTVGTYLELAKNRKCSVLLSGFGQWGKKPDGRTYSAYLASAVATFKIIPQLEIKAGYDYYTKDFNTFLGSPHIFLGIMDFFGGTGGPVSGKSDLHQPFLTLTAKPAEKHNLELTGRYFFTSELHAIGAPLGHNPHSRDLGVELSLVYNFNILPDLVFTAGYAWHSQSNLLDLMFESNGVTIPAHYGYIMLRYTPTFFDTEKRRNEE